MTTLTANLKHYYQCRSLCINYAFLLIFLPSLLWGEDRNELLLFCVVWPAAAGVLVSTMIKDVAQKPFVFLLPRYEMAIARTATVIGILAAILLGLAILRSNDTASALVGGIGAGLLFYWLGVGTGFHGAWVVVALAIVLNVVIFPATGRFVMASITGHAALTACIAGAVTVAAYRKLGRWDLRRRYCLRPGVETVSGYVSPARAREFAARNSGKLRDTPFDSFCMGQILKAAPYSWRRQAWAAIFRWVRPTVAAAWGPVSAVGVLFFLVTLVLCCGYLGDNGSVMFLIAGLLSLVGMRPGVWASFPCAIGRRERFRSLLAASVVRVPMASLTGLVCGLLSNAVPYVMPDVIDTAIHRILPQVLVSGGFVPADIDMVVLCVLVVPVVMLGMELTAKHPLVAGFLVPTGGVLLFAVIVVRMQSPDHFSMALKMTVIAWVAYIFGLFWGTARCNLVRRG